jgi:hypothetical protein
MRRKHEVVEGRCISCWDNGGETWDRYTVVYLDEEDDRGMVPYVGMSERPFHPQGFGQHGEMPVGNVAYRGRGGVFKKRIAFAELPPDCQRLVLQDLAELASTAES